MDQLKARFVRPPNPACECCHERTSDTFVLHLGWRCYNCLSRASLGGEAFSLIPGRGPKLGSSPRGIVGGNHDARNIPPRSLGT